MIKKSIKDLIPVNFLLILQALLILALLILADISYGKINDNYGGIVFSSEMIGLFFIIIGILLTGNSLVKLVFISIIVISILVQYCHFEYYGTYIQPISFYQFYGNSNEVLISFFADARSMIAPLMITLTISIAIFIIAKINVICKPAQGVFTISAVIFIGLIITYINLDSKSGKLWHAQEKNLLPIPNLHSTINFNRSLSYFLVGILPRKILVDSVNKFPALLPPELQQEQPNRNVILIIGETLRAQSLSILGYKKNNTTPLLSAMEGLYSSTIYSAGTMTKTSIPAILNRLKYPGTTNQITSQNNNLFNLAKKNGFITHFYSAQKDEHLDILQNYIGKTHIDRYMTRSSYSKKNVTAQRDF